MKALLTIFLLAAPVALLVAGLLSGLTVLTVVGLSLIVFNLMVIGILAGSIALLVRAGKRLLNVFSKKN